MIALKCCSQQMSKYIGRGGSYPNGGRKLQGESKRVTVSICIESDLLTKLDALVAQGEGSRSDIINRLLREKTK
jgi:hypothetical protein